MIDRTNFPGSVVFVPGILARDLGKFTDVEPQAPFTPAVNACGEARFMALDPLANAQAGDEFPEPHMNPAGIGDINSDAKGSGARFNNGKPDLSLIPLTMLAATYSDDLGMRPEAKALECLGLFQATHETQWLDLALEALGDGWTACAHVFTYGKKKYAAWNWAKGMPWSVPLACAARHLVAILNGEFDDSESSKPHLGHVFCNIVMLKQYVKTYTEGNDLPPKGLL